MPIQTKNPDALARLQIRRQERDTLLERITLLLEQDTRIVGAWLFGSLGRGTPDDLSDLDLFLVVDDASAEAVIADRYAHIAALGTPLLVLEAPQNRPPHGAYNMALYDGQFGPHQLDWYWQPRSYAAIPAETRVLLDRTGLPRLDTPPHFDYQPMPERDPSEVKAQTVNFFWVMLLIAAKYVARDPASHDTGLLNFVQSIHQDVRQIVPDTTPSAGLNLSDTPSPADKMRLLRTLAVDVETLMPHIAAQGIAVPDAIVPAAHRYLDLIEALL
jgi:hypothetical protein